jgi:hypothetical protein
MAGPCTVAPEQKAVCETGDHGQRQGGSLGPGNCQKRGATKEIFTY